MNFMNVWSAMHCYEELSFYGEDGDLYSDDDIDIFNMSYHILGVRIPCIEFAIHSVGFSFLMTFKPDTLRCSHCSEPVLDVDGIEVDPCMGGLLPGVRNACCGHGNPDEAYIQWNELEDDQSGVTIYPRYRVTRGLVAFSIIRHYADL